MPERSLAKAMRVPSGLTAGITSLAGSSVSWVTAVPPMVWRYRSAVGRCRVEAK